MFSQNNRQEIYTRTKENEGVILETAHTNLSGQKLYERMGFKREDLEYRTYFKAV